LYIFEYQTTWWFKKRIYENEELFSISPCSFLSTYIGEAYIYNMAEYSGKRKLVGTAGSDICTGTPHQVVLLEVYNMAYHSLSLSV
jgi:hypothetical protein